MLYRGFTDGGEHLSGETPIYLHAIHTCRCHFVDGRSCVGHIAHDARVWPPGWISIDDRSAGKEPRPGILPILDLLAFLEDLATEVPGVANRRDTMRQKEQPVQLPIRRDVVYMHIDQARQHI